MTLLLSFSDNRSWRESSTFSTVAGGGNINLGSTLNNATGESIAFIAGTGNVDVTGAVTLGAGNITVTSATNVDFRNTVSATDFTQADGTGTTTFAGTITLADAFDFTGNNLTINGTGNNVTGAMTVDNAGIFTTGPAADLTVGNLAQISTAGTGTNTIGNVTIGGMDDKCRMRWTRAGKPDRSGWIAKQRQMFKAASFLAASSPVSDKINSVSLESQCP